MKKLFEVTLTAMVLADDETDAEIIATDADLLDEATVEVSEASCVPSEWYDAKPFVGDDVDDDRTCGQIMQEQMAEAKYSQAQLTIPAAKKRGAP